MRIVVLSVIPGTLYNGRFIRPRLPVWLEGGGVNVRLPYRRLRGFQAPLIPNLVPRVLPSGLLLVPVGLGV